MASSDETLKNSSRVILILSAAAFAFAGYINYWTPLTIQTYILAENCAQNDTVGCCRYCLGLSAFEYGFGIGAAAFISIFCVIFSGAGIDLFGLPKAGIILASVQFFGSVIFALAPYRTQYHGVVLAAFGVARFCNECAVIWALTLVQYVGIRYFEPKWQSLAISLVYSAASTGALLGTLFGAHIASSFGVHFVFWCDALADMLPMCSAVGFILMFRYSKDIVNFEESKRTETRQALTIPTAKFVAESLRTFTLEYWLIAFITALTSTVAVIYVGNAPLIQTELFELSSVKVAQNLSYNWIIIIFITPLLGYVLKVIPIHLFVAFAGLVIQGLTLLVLIVPHGSPLVSSMLCTVPYAIILMTLSPFFETTIPMSALGLASTIVHAVDLILTGVLSIVLGAVLNNDDKRVGSVNAIYLLSGVVGVQYFLFTVLCIKLKCQCHPKERKECQRLLDSQL